MQFLSPHTHSIHTIIIFPMNLKNKKETFVLFKQLSMDFIPNDTKTNPRIKRASSDQHELHLQFAIYYTSRTLLLQFKNALKYQGYKCIEIGDRQLLIIRAMVLDRFKKLFMCRQPPKFILTITTHQFLSVRTVSIKPLKSNSSFANTTISLHQLSTEVNTIGELLLGLRTLNQGNATQANQLENEYHQDFFSLDATSYYMFSRMLVESNYSLGKKILTVFNKLKSQQNIQNCSKTDIHWLHQALNEISNDLLQGFNCSRKELLQILAYCRKSVEQYYYNIHLQHQKNKGKMEIYDSEGHAHDINQLSRLVPETLKQFLHLERVKTSMGIYKTFFMLGLIFKAQQQVKNLNQEDSNQALHLLRKCFSGVINQKSRLLRHFGYDEQTFTSFLLLFKFDHEVTF